MESFAGKIAVVTGGGSGMGRELVRQLAVQGCSVATCDLNAAAISATVSLAQAGAPPGILVTGHVCDVADETQVLRFRDEVLDQHATSHLNLVFSNAGIGGGGSFVRDSRQDWERTFAIDFWGVYYCARAFLPLLIAGDEGVLVNTSSINGFWASLGPGIPHTAYCTAKFAVKGFSEALIEDLRVNAPHVRVAVVMPGHIGTDIINNSRRILGSPGQDQMSDEEVEAARAAMTRFGAVAEGASVDELRQVMARAGDAFRDSAPMTAAEAAAVILDEVRKGSWRILVGEDAKGLDAVVRANPEAAYDFAALAGLAAQAQATAQAE